MAIHARRSFALAALLLALSVAAVRAPWLGAQAAPVTVISIVGTNDLHGGVLERGGRGGLEWLGGYLTNLRAARAHDGGAVVLVDAGDMFQGTLESNLSEGAVVVDAYNTLGYSAVTIGNHEFDFGPVGAAATPASPADDPRGALKARAAQARFPFLAANLIDVATGHPVTWPNVLPSTMVDAAGVKVGIVGVLTRRALSATIAANTQGLRVDPLAPAIAAESARLRQAGARVVVAVAHAGGQCRRFDQPLDVSSCDVATSEIAAVARALPAGAVDVLVAGHTHAGMAHEIAGIRIVESYSGGRAFGRVDVAVDRATGRVLGRRSFAPQDLVAGAYEGAPVTRDTAIAAVLAPAIAAVRELKATPIPIVLDEPIRREGHPESPLGNLFTDAFLAAVPGADIAINNTSGGLRADLPAGPLTYGRLFEVFPFDDRLVRFAVPARDLARAFVARFDRRGSMPGVAGLRVDAACAGAHLVVTLRRPSGVAVPNDELLTVVTTDFLVQGGDGLFSSIEPPQGFDVQDDGVMARDVVVAWLTHRGGRLRQAQLAPAGPPRVSVPARCP